LLGLKGAFITSLVHEVSENGAKQPGLHRQTPAAVAPYSRQQLQASRPSSSKQQAKQSQARNSNRAC